ncbi:hypothetical protein FZEAL_6455, partial [Fusarium zealandicum]
HQEGLAACALRWHLEEPLSQGNASGGEDERYTIVANGNDDCNFNYSEHDDTGSTLSSCQRPLLSSLSLSAVSYLALSMRFGSSPGAALTSMKNFITCTLAATLVAGANAHQHQHQHIHARRQAGTKVAKRGPALVTHYVAATETIYELGGAKMDHEKAKAGLHGGKLVIVGESDSTYDAPVEPEAQVEVKATLAAQFYESKPAAQPTPVYEATIPSVEVEVSADPVPAKPKQPKTPKKSSSESGPSYDTGSSGLSGVNRKFESGKVRCSEFPSAYGAVALDWLDMSGWSGIQFVPDFTLASLSIVQIDTGIAGDSCTKGAMCSYACPPGYQKTQWPKAQGSTKESVGGLYCNNEGYLELTRDEFDTLCDPGVGGVSIQNDLDDDVVTCRTDYPGTESMVIPAIAKAGSSVDICNPNQEKYYVWDGSGTSAQYYVNKKGYGVKDACVWNSPMGKDAGNWSPVILGVGQASDGITYISIFQNLPTSNAKLDFNIEIKGDVNSKCSYVNGKWSGGANGCTTGMPEGGKAVIRYF